MAVHLIDVIILVRIDFDCTAVTVTVVHYESLGFDKAVLEITSCKAEIAVTRSIVSNAAE